MSLASSSRFASKWNGLYIFLDDANTSSKGEEAMPSSRDDIIVFYSYAEEDRVWQSELEKHLNRPGNFIQSYHRGSIRAGYEMEREIPRLIEEASLILLLLSPDYFA